MLAAVSYIFFDVLDLDGSNFSRLLTSMERSIVVAEAASPSELFGSPRTIRLSFNIPDLSTEESRELNLEQTKAFGIAALDWAHYHGYRLGSPRDLAVDSAPDH